MNKYPYHMVVICGMTSWSGGLKFTRSFVTSIGCKVGVVLSYDVTPYPASLAIWVW